LKRERYTKENHKIEAFHFIVSLPSLHRSN
jgi:hypothetical protein